MARTFLSLRLLGLKSKPLTVARTLLSVRLLGLKSKPLMRVGMFTVMLFVMFGRQRKID